MSSESRLSRPKAPGAGMTGEGPPQSLLEPSGGVGQHGVDLAGLGDEIAARRGGSAFVARDLVEQPLEFRNIAVDGVLEVAVAAVALADLVERLLALRRVEAAREDVALAAVIAIPHVAHLFMVDHAGDVDRDRIERLDGVPARAFLATRR